MGLDMYLDKVRRIDNATLDDLVVLNEYFDYKERPEKCKKRSMKEWCGIDFSKVNKKLIPVYRSEYNHKYASWDTEKEFGHNTLFQNIAYWRKANHIHN